MLDKTQAVGFNVGMTTIELAKSQAETTLRAYEDCGRQLPEDIGLWTPAQRQQLRRTRDAYYAALKAYNALRYANAS